MWTYVHLGMCNQGGKESPWGWSVVMRHALELFRDQWEQRGLGIVLPVVGRVACVVWADNIYFISRQPCEIRWMAQDLTEVLQFFGLRWKPFCRQWANFK